MDEIIRELFRGNFEAFEPKYSEESRHTQAFCRMEEMMHNMQEEIPEEYHALLGQYEKALMELLDAACEDDYVLGYQHGVRMMLAAWPSSPKPSP